MRVLAGNPSSAASVFAILEQGITGSPPAIMADNYEKVIALLDCFASAAIPRTLLGQRGVGDQHKGNRQTSPPEA